MPVDVRDACVRHQPWLAPSERGQWVLKLTSCESNEVPLDLRPPDDVRNLAPNRGTLVVAGTPTLLFAAFSAGTRTSQDIENGGGRSHGRLSVLQWSLHGGSSPVILAVLHL